MKIVSAEAAAALVRDGMTVMIGGFMACGTPAIMIEALLDKGVRDLTVIANDAGSPVRGIGRLIAAGAVKKLIATHVGLNPQVGRMMSEGTLEVILIPQGTLAEQIRCGGAGLGGVLTPTGLGTESESGKEKIWVDGKLYLLEKPVKADVALLRGSLVDEAGNVFYKGTTRNFNPLMATAAATVIVAAEAMVPVGGIAGELVVTPGIFVDYVVEGEPA